MTFLWLKALHILAVITWMAGVFYIYRLFAFHVARRDSADATALLRVMERRMLRVVMWPGAALSLALGLALLGMRMDYLSQHWFQLKLAAVAGMLAYNAHAEYTARRFARGEYFLTEVQNRLMHVVPTVLLGVIVVMVVVRPF
ncbi:MAG: CopD family protein [Gemmatimonadetes bacterium]|nr:CopD family protein [Gemmatimonadota bacterium]